MRRIFIVLLLLSSLPLFSAIVPYSERVGRIVVDIEEGSKADIISKAFKEEYSDEWLARYAGSDDLFMVAYSSILAELLPMTNLVIAEEGDNAISFYSLDTKDVVSVIFKDGYIAGLSVRKLGSQAHQED